MSTKAVFRLLAPTGNQAVLGAGLGLGSLAIGQIGFFNYHTSLSIDGTVAADMKDIFIAVGTDPNATGILSDIDKSAGQTIQVRNARYLTFKGYLANIAKVVDITDFYANCQTEYVMKVRFRNGLGYELNGNTLIHKTFSFTTGCCPDQCGTPCALGDTNELVQGMIAAINADPEGLLTASAVGSSFTATVSAATSNGNTTVTVGLKTYTVPVLSADTAAQTAAKIVDFVNNTNDSVFLANTGAVITVKGNAKGIFGTAGSGVVTSALSTVTKTVITDIPGYVAANPGSGLGIRLTSGVLPTSTYGNINNKYTKFRATDFDATLIQGFTCNGVVTVVTEPQRAEGLGYDVAQLEYVAQGWGKGGPYRLSSVLGQERGGFINVINRTGTYNAFILGYDQMSVGGWLEYLNNLETLIYVPCADATTMGGIATVMDLIFTQFGAMANDVTANGDCTNQRTGLLTPATDGLESLA